MFFWMILKVALKSLTANKLRSTLAMLGIIIGVGAVISMLAIGAGAQRSIMERFTAMGTNLLTVRPGQRGTGGVMSGTQQNLTVEDAQALLAIPGVQAIAPAVSNRAQVKYMSKNTRTEIQGTTVTYFSMRNFEIEHGKAFTDFDADINARVAVLGPVTVTNLFGAEDPINKIIKINGMNFRVIGAMKAKGDQGWFNPDDQIIIPYTTAMKQLFGLDYVREITVRVADTGSIDKVQADIYAMMRKRHRVQPDQPDDVQIRNQAEFLSAANEATQTFTILLGSVAAISLVVGGIGIMNIMLVTVTERTREIGIRKAIGARNRDILRQFLIEAVLMSASGGLLGVGLGVGIALLISTYTSFSTYIQAYAIVLSITFSAAVGIFFGFYPAWRAAKLDPIEALRYE